VPRHSNVQVRRCFLLRAARDFDSTTEAHEGADTTTTTLTLSGLYEVRKRADASGITLQHVYYLLGGEDGPVAQVVYDETTHEETTTYLAKDGLGSISAVFDTQGKLLERLYHEPFGRRVGSSGEALQDFVSSADVALGFTGQRHDDDLSLIDYNGRVYDPTQKRFLTPDPLISKPLHSQSYNRYSYVGNNPLRYIDPSGFEGQGFTDNGCTAGCGLPEPVVLPMDTIYGAPPTPGPAPTPVPSSDGRGSAIPAARPADEDSVARETLLPSTWHIRHEPTDLPTPEVRIEGEMRGPEDVTDFTVRYGGQAADSVATGSTIAWGVLTLGTGYYGGKGLTAGGRQAIDGVVDGDADKIIDGAVTLGETALEITNAPQAIADALTPDGREPPRASALPRAAGGAKRGPKTDPDAPHNAEVRAQGDALRAEGNTIEAGGGERREQLRPTEGGHKSGRRPDIIYRTPSGELRGRNVGLVDAQGRPVSRERKALDDLNGPGKLPTDFVPYNKR